MLYDVILQGPTGAQKTFLVSGNNAQRASDAALRRIAASPRLAIKAGWMVLHVIGRPH